MKNFKQDPRLTAYALNELSDNDRKAFEEEIRDNPGAQAEIQQIRALAQTLEQEFGAEATPGLTAEQQHEIEDAAAEAAGRRIPFPRMPWGRIGALAAAALAVALGMNVLMTSYKGEERGAEYSRTLFGSSGSSHSGGGQTKHSEQPESSVREEVAVGLQYASESGVIADSPASMRPETEESEMLVAEDIDMGEVIQVTVDEEKPVAMPRRKRVEAQLARTTAFKGRSAGRRIQQGMPAVPCCEPVLGDACLLGVKRVSTPDAAPRQSQWGPSIERYDAIEENAYRQVQNHPLSTFSIDVDTASYANLRRFLKNGQMPPRDAVRIEEMVNYFPYTYAPPTDEHLFAVHLENGSCPWAPDHRLVRIGLKGRELVRENRPACNLVFLLDVSGSMNDPNKLPLVKKAMKMLVRNLDKRDRVAIVVYAGASGVVLPATACDDPHAIEEALERLKAGGSTNGGAGIELAYRIAKENFVKDGVNRVILCTDGDFNVGVTQSGDLVRMVKEKAKDGIFLTVLGFGMGNYKDSTLEKLADKGNGNYAYIDTFSEARKVLVDQLTGTLVTIAKDVKIQVEFNPARVQAYRLIGYENRMLKKEDFNDDKKDAGEIGAGHTVTALYELIPVGAPQDEPPTVDPLKYQSEVATDRTAVTGEWLTVKLRYKQPDEDVSMRIEFPLADENDALVRSTDSQFAAAVAAFGMLLRDSQFKGQASYDLVLELAQGGLGADPYGYRREFLELVRNAKALDNR